MEKKVNGWKCFDSDLACRGHKFEIGKTYKIDGEITMCKHGWHFHAKKEEIFNYYENAKNHRVCEVIGFDVITDGDKSVCRKIKVVRELSYFEICCLIGDGSGYGYGYGYGNGNGYGDVYGNGYGNGCGYGYGNGDGDGYGKGDGDGYGYGKGDGDGSGNGDRYGYGCGYGVYELPDFIEFSKEKAS